MIFDRVDQMPVVKPEDRFGWVPRNEGGELLGERERRITYEWLSGRLHPENWAQCKRWLDGRYPRSGAKFLQDLSRWDEGVLVELLYPRSPTLFLASHPHFIANELFLDEIRPPVPLEQLQRYVYARTTQLNAACLFAASGAVSCLEALLEQGADPNGLDHPQGWSYVELNDQLIMPVTPLDCARLTGQEDCQLVLELYGGKGLHEMLPA